MDKAEKKRLADEKKAAAKAAKAAAKETKRVRTGVRLIYIAESAAHRREVRVCSGIQAGIAPFLFSFLSFLY